MGIPFPNRSACVLTITMGKTASLLPSWVKTLGAMIDHGARVQVWCGTCDVWRTFTQDDLVALAEKVGREYSLVDRRCRCRLTPGCDGWNRFRYRNGMMWLLES